LMALLFGWIAIFEFGRSDRRLFLIPGLVFMTIVLVWIGRLVSGHHFAPRYLLAAYPAHLLFLGLGLLHGLPVLFRKLAHKDVSSLYLRVLLPALGLGFYLYPAWMAHRWVGGYKAMVAWADETLPAGTPILCDRYFTAWNEFPANGPRRVSFMSTQPNQLLSEYETDNWRASAEAYLLENPDAAFFEQKMHWDRLGPWTWPHRWFQRKKVFEDLIDIELRRMGLRYDSRSKKVRASAGDSVAIYYNTLEDLIERASADGDPLVLLYGDGWQYAKTADLADWRQMDHSAEITIWNAAETHVVASMDIDGVSVGGDKELIGPGGERTIFMNEQPMTWRLSNIRLAPGKNALRLTDPSGRKRVPQLLVQRIAYVVAESD
ncbi:MAG: hypothetical protein AAF492_24395, partial [Verrucomicrobiota bacterium]